MLIEFFLVIGLVLLGMLGYIGWTLFKWSNNRHSTTPLWYIVRLCLAFFSFTIITAPIMSVPFLLYGGTGTRVRILQASVLFLAVVLPLVTCIVSIMDFVFYARKQKKTALEKPPQAMATDFGEKPLDDADGN